MNLSIRGGRAGFTLVELLIVIAVLAVGLTIAVPSMREFLKNNRVASQNNELVALISLAKSQAIRRNEPWQVRLDSDADGFSWSGNVRPAEGGLDPDDPDDAGCPEIPDVIRCSDFQGVKLVGAQIITFNNRGFLEMDTGVWDSVELRLEHQGCTGARQAREIEILPTGQLTSQAAPCLGT